MNARDIFFFDSMLTPKIITLVYWISLFGVVIAGLISMFGGLTLMFGGYGGLGIGKLLIGLFIIVGGALAARIYCELLIVLFKIHENLKRMAEKAD